MINNIIEWAENRKSEALAGKNVGVREAVLAVMILGFVAHEEEFTEDFEEEWDSPKEMFEEEPFSQ